MTTLYDWDPQPIILPISYSVNDVGGEGAVMATSDPLGSVVLFGGLSVDGLTNLTLVVNQTTGNWATPPLGPAPSPRANASLATGPGGRYAVLFGGEVNSATGATDNQTWVFDFANDTWTNVTKPVAPPSRESAAFAIDPTSGLGLLEGGWDPAANIGGAGASVTWNDTWVLNLTTMNWSQVFSPSTPRPMFGSAMVWDTADATFLLFGGCSNFCSNGLYAYRIGGNWTRLVTTGDVPTPRGAASMVWSSTWNIAMLSGGFDWGLDLGGLNDSYVYTPGTKTWDLIAALGPGPSARFASATAFLANNQCPGMFVVGGSSALTLPPADGWFLDSNPDYGNGCNVWGGDQVGGPSGGPGPKCGPQTNLTVLVRDSANLTPIDNASVTVVGACGNFGLRTNATGIAYFSNMANVTVTVTAFDAVYHANSTVVNMTLGRQIFCALDLTHLPILTITTFGIDYVNGRGPLGNVTVGPAGGIPIGNSNVTTGVLFDPGYAGPQGSTVFQGTKPYYSNASTTVQIPYTGWVNFSLTLLADGPFEVDVRESPDGFGIAGAVGLIVPVGADTYGSSLEFVTGATGWFNATLPQANYSVSVSAKGYVPNGTKAPVFHAWVQPTLVAVNLTLAYGANLSVQLRDKVTQKPIGNGRVIVGYFAPKNTSASGWANFTDLLPPGEYAASGLAQGYVENTTTVRLTYHTTAPTLVLNLTPATSCTLSNCSTGPPPGPVPFHLLPSSGAALDVFILAPLALVFAAAIYVAYLRRPSPSGAA